MHVEDVRLEHLLQKPVQPDVAKMKPNRKVFGERAEASVCVGAAATMKESIIGHMNEICVCVCQ